LAGAHGAETIDQFTVRIAGRRDDAVGQFVSDYDIINGHIAGVTNSDGVIKRLTGLDDLFVDFFLNRQLRMSSRVAVDRVAAGRQNRPFKNAVLDIDKGRY